MKDYLLVYFIHILFVLLVIVFILIRLKTKYLSNNNYRGIIIKNNPINEMLDVSLSNIARMIDINKVVGAPLKVGDNNILIPISRVSFGFGVGGSEFNSNTNKTFDLETSEELFPFGGGSGAGVNIRPVAFLSIKDNRVEVIKVENNLSLMDKVIDISKDLFNNDNK